MARTDINSSAILTIGDQGLSVAAGERDIPFEASDAANGLQTPCTGKELMVVANTDVGAQTVTSDAAPDA